MRRSLIYFLVVGVPGLCLLIGGSVSHEYPPGGARWRVGYRVGLSVRTKAGADPRERS